MVHILSIMIVSSYFHVNNNLSNNHFDDSEEDHIESQDFCTYRTMNDKGFVDIMNMLESDACSHTCRRILLKSDDESNHFS